DDNIFSPQIVEIGSRFSHSTAGESETVEKLSARTNQHPSAQSGHSPGHYLQHQQNGAARCPLFLKHGSAHGSQCQKPQVLPFMTVTKVSENSKLNRDKPHGDRYKPS